MLITCGTQLIKYVIVPFARRLEHHSGFLQQIRLHRSTGQRHHLHLVGEQQFRKLPESRTIIVSRRLGITDRLHNRTARQHLPFDLRFRLTSADGRKVTHRILGRHRFPRSRFTADNYAEITFLAFQLGVRFFGHGKDVRLEFAHRVAAIGANDVRPVERQIGVRIDGHQHDAAVCVDDFAFAETNLEIVQDVGFVQIGECCEVILADKYGGIAKRWQVGLGLNGYRVDLTRLGDDAQLRIVGFVVGRQTGTLPDVLRMRHPYSGVLGTQKGKFHY